METIDSFCDKKQPSLSLKNEENNIEAKIS